MIYHEYKPSAEMSQYVKCFWTLESEGKSSEPARERILPDGSMELVFHYGEYFKRVRQNGQHELQPRTFVYGQIRRFIEIEPTGSIGVVAVRFHPNGAAPFLQMPINELTDQAIALDELLGKAGRQLEDSLLCACSNRERISLLHRFFLNRLDAFRKQDYLVDECIRMIGVLCGHASVHMLAKDLNVSERQLERRFIANVGIRPKLFSRIARFQHSLKRMQNNNSSLTSLAADCGYYDQAHFIRDFKEFSGINPKCFLSGQHQLSDVLTSGG